MVFISISWTLVKYIESILGKGDQISKFIRKFKQLGVEDLPQELLIVSLSTNVEFLKIKTG